MDLWAKIIWRCVVASCLLVCAKTAGRDLEDDFRAPDELPITDWSVCRLTASCANQRQPPFDLALGDLIKADVPQSFFASVLPFHLHSRDAAFDPDVVYFRTQFVYSLVIHKAFELRVDWLDTWAAVHRRMYLRLFDSQGSVLCDLPHNVSALLAPREAPDGSATSYPVRIDGVLKRTIAWPAVHWARETHAAQRLSLRLQLVVDGADVAADAAATNLLQHARELIRFTVHSAAVAHFPQPGKRRLHDELDARALYSRGGKTASLHLPLAVFDDPCFLLNTSHAALLHKLRIAPPPPTGPDSPWARRRAPQSSLPRVLCVVYTTDARLETQVETQRGTWLRKCTAFLVVANSSRTDDENVVDLPFAGEESYANLWQKLRALWKYVYAHYRGAFDWFLVGGDDLYVVAENLFAFLASPQVEAAVRRGSGVYAGRAMRFNASSCAAAGASAQMCSAGATDDPAALREAQEALYHSGGAGYVLDAAALRVLGRALLVQHHYERDGDGGGERLVQETGCKAHLRTSIEDALVGQCLYRLAHRPDALPALPAELAALPPVTVLDTRDALGRERFHVLPPGVAFAANVSELRASHWVGVFANATLRGGADCCAASSVSFHYLFRFWMAAVDAFLYRCPAATAAAFFARRGADFYATHWLDAQHTLV